MNRYRTLNRLGVAKHDGIVSFIDLYAVIEIDTYLFHPVN